MSCTSQNLIDIGFTHFCDLSIINDKLCLDSNKTFTNQIYAILIDDVLTYIGKTNNFRKRFDTYRNCINWVSCNNQNRIKTSLLLESILQQKKISIYYKHAIFDKDFIDFDDNKLKVQSLLEEEKRIIKKFNPKWNKHHAKNIKNF